MYTHFAVVTVCLTAGVGILADGEAQQSVAQRQNEKLEQQRIASNDALADGNRRLITADESEDGGGSFGSDISMGGFGGNGFGSSTTALVDVTGSALSIMDNRPIWQRVGLSEEDWNKLSDAQKSAVALARDPLFGRSEEQQREDVRRMSEASRVRAGNGASSEGSDGPG